MTAASPLDDRMTCTTCAHLVPARGMYSAKCLNFHRAAVGQPWLSDWLVNRPQRCPGYAPEARPPPTAPATPTEHPKTEAQTDRDRRQTEPQHPSHTHPEQDTDMIVSENTGGAAFKIGRAHV